MWWRVLSLLSCFPVQGVFLSNHTETVTVEEGQTLTLNCVTSLEKNASLQWLAPSGFTIFLNEYPALKNTKYQLLHYSDTQLSINVPRVTLQDEGVYKCLHYSNSVSTKEVKVIVLAIPSKPTVEASIIRRADGEEHIVLTCSTKRSKPAPRITWLLGTDLEIYSGARHEFETDGKTCNTASTLLVRRHSRDSAVRCVVRHRGLRGRELVATFRFEDLVTDRESASGAPEKAAPSSPDPQEPTSTVLILENSTIPEMNGEEKEPTTQDSDLTSEAHPLSVELTRRKSGILLLTLVSFLIFVLFVIVQLFIMKLRKAHVIWKKENEISEHTLESYRSRSNNEETSSQEKNGQTTRSKRCMTYITRLYSETKPKTQEDTQQAQVEKCTHIPESIV